MADNDNKYLPELMAEKDSIDSSFVHAVRLITQEIERLKNPKKNEHAHKPEKNLLEVVSGRPQRVECDVRVPTEAHPSVNFVGRLIGPSGSTMKGIQELTNTRMAVLGKGSVREKDRKRLEDSGKNDLEHLKYPLHVHVTSFAPLPQAYVNLGRACAEVQKILQVDEDTETQFAAAQGMLGSGRGGGRGGRGGMMGNPRGRGSPSGARGSVGGRFQRGGVAPRGGGSTGRGMGVSRGAVGRGSTRGAARGAGRGQQQAYKAAESYAEDYSYDSYGTAASAAQGSGYDASGYGEYDESYDASYDASGYSADSAAYGEGGYGESYDSYGYGAESYDGYGNGSAASGVKTQGYGGGGQASFRGKMAARGGMRGRQKPY